MHRFNERATHIRHFPYNCSTLGAIERTVHRYEAPRRALSQAQKTDVTSCRRGVSLDKGWLIAGESDVGMARCAPGRVDSACDCNHRHGPSVMTIVGRDGRLRGPADLKRIDIHSPAEMRHWVREIGRPAAKLNEAVKAVGPLVSDVRDYLQNRSLYAIRR